MEWSALLRCVVSSGVGGITTAPFFVRKDGSMLHLTQARRLVIVCSLVLAAVAGPALPAIAVGVGSEGCTPGYWKNHEDSWEEYRPDQTLKFTAVSRPGYRDDHFFVWPATLSSFETMTMRDALRLGGGPGLVGATNVLMRATAAAYLNAAHDSVGYPYRRFDEPDAIRRDVANALQSQDRATILALAGRLDAANNLGCPLN